MIGGGQHLGIHAAGLEVVERVVEAKDESFDAGDLISFQVASEVGEILTPIEMAVGEGSPSFGRAADPFVEVGNTVRIDAQGGDREPGKRKGNCYASGAAPTPSSQGEAAAQNQHRQGGH